MRAKFFAGNINSIREHLLRGIGPFDILDATNGACSFGTMFAKTRSHFFCPYDSLLDDLDKEECDQLTEQIKPACNLECYPVCSDLIATTCSRLPSRLPKAPLLIDNKISDLVYV